MKAAILISAGLIAAIVGLDWWQGLELEALRAERDAARAGASAAERESGGTDSIRRPRPDKQGEARRVAADFIAYANEMSALGYDATQNPEGELRRRIIAQMNEVTSLDSRQFGMLIGEVVASTELSDSSKATILRWGLPRLIETRPADALAILTPEGRRLMRVNTSGGPPGMLNAALARLAEDDPEAALAWYRENRHELEPDLRRSAEFGLLGPMAAQDLMGTLRLVDELGLDRDSFILSLAGAAGRTPEQRALAVEVLRKWRWEDSGERSSHFNSVLGNLLFRTESGFAGFEETVARIEQLDLSAEEMDLVVFPEISRSGHHPGSAEAARWADWLANGSGHEVDQTWLLEFYKKWTTADHEAAEAWLEGTADGPAKHHYIRAFGDEMGKHQPELARHWLEKLPPGPEREAALRWLSEISPEGR